MGIDAYIKDFDRSITLIKYTELKPGLSKSKIYKIETLEKVFVLKVFPIKYEQRIIQQINIVDTLLENSIPTPKIFHVNYNFDNISGYLVMEYIEGETLFESFSNIKALRSAGEVLRKIHQIKKSDVWEDPKRGTRNSNDWRRFLYKQLDRSISYLASYENFARVKKFLENFKEENENTSFDLKPLHWDYNPQNILIYHDKVSAILDLEAHRVGDYLNDLGIAYYWFYYYEKKEMFPYFLEGYGVKESLMETITKYTTLQTVIAFEFLISSNTYPKGVARLKTMLEDFCKLQ